MPDQSSAYATETIAADDLGIARAADVIRSGGCVAIPTETVYGLACDATSSAAVARVYAAKGRPSFNPLIVHVSDIAMAERYAQISAEARALMARFWPGPLTLVLPTRTDACLASLVTAGLDTVALRCPDHPVPQALIVATGLPLAAPSANASGRITATSPKHVERSLGGRIPLILDGKVPQHGIESTIVSVGDGKLSILREGAIPSEALGLPASRREPAAINAPGQMASHYAPAQPVRLNASSAEEDEFLIGFAQVQGDLSLSPTGDLAEAAMRLFEALHVAEASGKARIAIAPIPEQGMGRAINDRLRRAAAPRQDFSNAL